MDPLHLPSPRRYAEGFNFASDAAPALDAYANGARLVSVTRVPVRSLVEAEAASLRLASAHTAAPSSGGLVVADWSEDFSRSAARLYTALSPSLDLGYVDAHALGQSAGVSALHEAVHEGFGSLWFVGHGSSRGLGGSLASPARFRSLANQGARPLTVVGLSCLSGNVASDYADRMPEELFRKVTTVQGALLGSNQTTMRVHERVGDALGAALADGERTLSDIWRAAMMRLLDEGLSAAELSAYSLVGDPNAPL